MPLYCRLAIRASGPQRLPPEPATLFGGSGRSPSGVEVGVDRGEPGREPVIATAPARATPQAAPKSMAILVRRGRHHEFASAPAHEARAHRRGRAMPPCVAARAGEAHHRRISSRPVAQCRVRTERPAATKAAADAGVRGKASVRRPAADHAGVQIPAISRSVLTTIPAADAAIAFAAGSRIAGRAHLDQPTKLLP